MGSNPIEGTILSRYVEYRKSQKEKLFEKYGNFCVCCGETERQFLTFDHTDGSGADHRERVLGNRRGNGPGGKLYMDMLRNDYPNIEVRCWNCNSGKKNGKCPHEEKLDILRGTVV